MEESLKFEETVVEEKPKKNKREILSVIFLVLSLVCLMISGFSLNVPKASENIAPIIFGYRHTSILMLLIYIVMGLLNLILSTSSIIGIVFYGIHLILRKAKIFSVIIYAIVALIYIVALFFTPILEIVSLSIPRYGDLGILINVFINLNYLTATLILALTMTLTAKTHKIIKVLLVVLISTYLRVLIFKSSFDEIALRHYNYYFGYVRDLTWIIKLPLYINLFSHCVGATLTFGVTFIALGIETLIKNKGKKKLISIAYFAPTLLSLFIVGLNIVYFVMNVLYLEGALNF